MVDAASSSESWIPAALTAFGGFATAAATFIGLRIADAKKDEKTYQREKTARDDARRDKIIERRNEQQREALIELQSVLQKFLRSSGKINHHDSMEFRRTGVWKKTFLPENVNDDSYDQGVQILALIVRTRDEKVREYAQEAKTAAILATLSPDQASSDKNMVAASAAFDRFNARVWEVLTSLDEIELAS